MRVCRRGPHPSLLRGGRGAGRGPRALARLHRDGNTGGGRRARSGTEWGLDRNLADRGERPPRERHSGGSELSRVRGYLLLAVIAATVVIVDRVTKIFVEQRFGVPYGPREVVDHVLFLTVTRNAGAAFGLFQNFRVVFLLVSAVVLVGILIYYWRLPVPDSSACLALALVSGCVVSTASA